MNVVDSSAWLEYFAGGSGADAFAAAIEDTGSLLVPLETAAAGARHRLPLADSVIFATARRANAELWTQDADFEGLPGVHYFPKR